MAAPQLEWMLFFYAYRKTSLKNAKRARWKSGNLEFKKVVGSQLIKQWNSFVSSDNKETELIKFSVAGWKKNARLFSDKLIYVTCEEECFFIFEGNCSTADYFFSTQEKADNQLSLAACISKVTGYYNTYT